MRSVRVRSRAHSGSHDQTSHYNLIGWSHMTAESAQPRQRHRPFPGSLSEGGVWVRDYHAARVAHPVVIFSAQFGEVSGLIMAWTLGCYSLLSHA